MAELLDVYEVYDEFGRVQEQYSFPYYNEDQAKARAIEIARGVPLAMRIRKTRDAYTHELIWERGVE